MKKAFYVECGWTLFVLYVCSGLWVGCKGGDGNQMPDAGQMASGMLGPAGGRIGSEGGLAIVIPAGAIDTLQMISVTASTEVAPEGAITPVYQFRPDGVVFARPVTITLPVPAGTGANARVFWSKHNGPGFEQIGGSLSGSTISAQVIHFSDGYVGPGSGLRTVSGSQVETFAGPSAIANRPIDLSAVSTMALVPNGSGGFTEVPGFGLADGTFSIPNVPEGTFYLKVKQDYYVTSSSIFDAGRVLLGRADVTLALQPTTLSFDVSGLDPWQSGDDLEAFSAEADIWWFGAGQGVVDGTSMLTGFTLDQAASNTSDPTRITPHLIDGSKGDRLTLAQLIARQSTNGVPYQAIGKIFVPGAFTQVDGQTTMLSGSFTDVSTANTLSIDLRASQFDAAVGWNGTNAVALHPRAVVMGAFSGNLFAVLGQPGGTQYGEYSSTADYLLLLVQPGVGDKVAQNMAYGAPTVGTWGTFGDARAGYSVAYQLPGSSAPALLSVGLSRSSDSLESFTSVPVTPVLGPVRSPQIAGRDLFQAQTGVGTTPIVSWQAPAIGSAKQYSVLVHRLFDDAGNTRQEQVASLQTPETSVVLPSGILSAGQSYVLRIIANTNPDVTSPLRLAPTSAASTVASEIVTP